MASTLKHLRSSTADKRPVASGLADGQFAINTASGTPGVFFKDSNGGVMKVGPAHVGATAPNAVPAGSAGNSLGELWVNDGLATPGLNYYTGSTFVNLTPSGTTATVGLVELATPAETQTGADGTRAVTPSGLQSKVSDSTSTTSSTTIASSTAVKSAYDLANAALPKAGGTVTGELLIGNAGSLVFEGSTNDNFETTIAVVDPTADRTITFPNVNGTVVTTGDSGTVTSTMIANDAIVNADINSAAAIAYSKLALSSGIVNTDISASAAIAGTKVSPDFGGQTITTSGVVSVALGTAGAPSYTFTGDTNTGLYSSGADQLALGTGGTGRLFVSSTGNVGIGTASPGTLLDLRAASNPSLHISTTGYTPDYRGYSIDLSQAQQTAGINFSLSSPSAFLDLYAGGSAANLGGWNGQIRFLTGGTDAYGVERMRITSAGLVGIGTSSPVYLVDAQGGRALFTDNSSTFSVGVRYRASLAPNGNFWIGATNAISPDMVFSNNAGNERMRITDAGLVGIGTTSPGTTLDIGSGTLRIKNTSGDTSGLQLYQDTGDTSRIYNYYNGPIAFGTNNTERLRITSTGLVGIGTSTPGVKVDVVSDNNTSLASVLRVNSNNVAVNTSLAYDGLVGSGQLTVQAGSSSALIFGSNAGEKARLDSSGRLLVGASIARAAGGHTGRLQLEGTDYETATASITYNANDANGGYLHFIKTRSGNTVVQSGDLLGHIRFYGTDGTAPVAGATIKAEVDGTPGGNDMPGRLVFSTTADGASSPTERMRITSAGLVGVGTLSPSNQLHVQTSSDGSGISIAHQNTPSGGQGPSLMFRHSTNNGTQQNFAYIKSLMAGGGDTTWDGHLAFATGGYQMQERMRIRNDGGIFIGKTTGDMATKGVAFEPYATVRITTDSTSADEVPFYLNRQSSDGNLIRFFQANTEEGNISVSGTTVSYNGAHLSRWSQLPSGAERIEILRGSVLSNIDEMCEWGDEDNEQLNRMKVSDVEGDKNVSGVFQAWDDDDDTYINDFYCAMTGDFIIRIAAGVTVERGDLLMSAGNGTAKPQDDDIIRSKTIAKVTSTNVSCTYDDGSYCVPCVLMAC